MGGNDSRPLPQHSLQQLHRLLVEHEPKTSVLLYNPIEAVRKIRTWRNTLPWIHPHYAIKANPAQKLLDTYSAEGANFDCASRAQIQQVLAMGVPAHRIVYSNSIKDESDLEWANRNGVQITTADSIDQLLKIKMYAPKMRILWRISIKEDSKDNLSTSFSGKFGDDLDSQQQIHERMSQIQDLGVSLKGIHFHCGSGLHGSSGFSRAVTKARECIQVGREYGHEMSVMDVGGGFPAGELNDKTVSALRQTKNDPLGYQVIAEPGRHFSTQMFYLVCRVIGKRTKSGRTCYHVNDSLYHSFNCNLMDNNCFKKEGNQFYAAVDGEGKAKTYDEQEDCTLFGMTCDGLDIISPNIQLPKALQVSDWLCLSAMGSYTYGCRSNFNGMKSTELIAHFPVSFEEEQTIVTQKEQEIFHQKISILV